MNHAGTLRGLLATLAYLAGCSAGSEASSVPPQVVAADPTWSYEVEIAPAATAGHVKVCFSDPPGSNLVASPQAMAYLSDPRNVTSDRALPRHGSEVSLDDVSAGDCIAYRVDFEAMGRDALGRRVQRVGDSLAVRTSSWLWHPDVLPDDLNATVRVRLPAGVELSVPWQPLEGARGDRERVFRLDPTAFRWLGITALGDLRLDRFEAAGADIELARLDRPLIASPEGLRHWIRDAAQSTALLYGAFPRDRLQVLVRPVPGDGSNAVHFGMATRGGGPGVTLLLDDAAPDDRLPGEWDTVHEFIHHGMPFVEDAWMAEGWVSYYTEILRTRMGHRTEAEGWEKLLGAFDRGDRRPFLQSLQWASDHMHSTFSYQRVYWGGAAIAFMLDVELRRESDGARSLDDAMRELRRCCGDTPRLWSAHALLEHLDSWSGTRLFTELTARHLASSELAPVEEGFEALGITIDDGQMNLDDDHPLAGQRRAIMAPRDRAPIGRP